MKDHSSIAKITKPSISGIFQRERLFRILDTNRRRPLVWVSGPAGSGKTTLVASYLDSRHLPCLWYRMDEGDADIATFFYYLGLAANKASSPVKNLPLLTPEYLHGIPVFIKRYFEQLCSGLETPFILVFDNYQDVPDASGFHDMIVHGLDVIPEGVTVIVISRKEPLPQFVRFRADKKCVHVGWDVIRFTVDEYRQIVRLYGHEYLTDETLAEIHGRTQGWMAGLVLIMEGTTKAIIGQEAFSKMVPETIFDYFASEILEKMDSVRREFLLKTALFPTMTSQMAQKLTGIHASEEILSQLYKSHYFIEMRDREHPVYHYHPLFRAFLLSKAKSVYTREEISLILLEAAVLLEESGQIEHASLLLREAEDWEGLARLVLKSADPLVRQGRGRTLLDWIASIPKTVVETSPWLLYWIGICKMSLSIDESRASLEQSFDTFKRQKDVAGIYLSWAAIINTFAFEFGDFSRVDRWISEIEALLVEYPEFPSREAEALVTYGIFTALMYRQPQHPDFSLWEERILQIVVTTTDMRLRTAISGQLLLYYSWMTGQLTKVAFLINTLKSASQSPDADPLSCLVWRSFEAAYYWLAASDETCLNTVNDGLAFAEEKGIHVCDAMFLGVGTKVNTTSGNLKEADKFLKRMSTAVTPSNFCMMYLHHYVGSFVARLCGDLSGSVEHGQACLDAGTKSGVPFGTAFGFFALGSALLDNNEREKGLAYLDDGLKLASSIKSRTAAYLCLLRKAEYFLMRKEEKKGLDALAKAFAIGKQQGFFNNSAWQDSVMSFLCAKALAAGIEVEHVQELIQKRNLVPDASAVGIEDWPWPLRIYALGQFRTEKDGKPLIFSGKVQKKPLELLKTMIALGGRDVSEAKLTDTLWPDAEGDAAHRAFVTTLQRLRKLLGRKEVIRFQDGRLGLDLRYCWVDALAFEGIVKKADEAWKAGKKKQAIRITTKAVALYGGPLLGQDGDEFCIVTFRESLRKKFMRCLGVLGHHAENSGEWEKAVTYYDRVQQSSDWS